MTLSEQLRNRLLLGNLLHIEYLFFLKTQNLIKLDKEAEMYLHC